MALEYLSQEDCRRRLLGTICTYKNNPVFVEDIPHNVLNVVQVIDYWGERRGRKELRINVSDPDFYVGPFPLGFINMPTVSVYLSRVPRRHAIEGTHSNNVLVNGRSRDCAEYLFSPSFLDMWENKYPSLKECEEKLQDTSIFPAPYSTAFSRHLALVRYEDSLKVMWGTRPIAQKQGDFYTILPESNVANPLLMKHFLQAHGLKVSS